MGGESRGTGERHAAGEWGAGCSLPTPHPREWYSPALQALTCLCRRLWSEADGCLLLVKLGRASREKGGWLKMAEGGCLSASPLPSPWGQRRKPLTSCM